MKPHLRRPRSLSRRQLMVMGGITTAASTVGCDVLSTDPRADDRDDAQDQDRRAKQSDMLAERVRAGDLPELAGRIPDDPLVVQTVANPGRYGGQLRSAILGAAEVIQLERIVGYDCLMRWSPDWEPEPIPNIAESVDVNDDSTEFTFRLRPGTRWSSGEPFTADDLVFAQNDVLNNPDLYPSESSNPVVAEKIDEHEVRFVFEQPNSLFLQEQAATSGLSLVTTPMHYLKQFHKEHNPDVGELVDEHGSADWTELFLEKSERWSNHEIPTLAPWMMTHDVGEGTQLVLERNPYYWKVDADRRQLPYIDEVVYELISEPEVILTKVMNGDIDFQLRPSNTLENKPVLARNRPDGDYDFAAATPSNMNTMVFCFNLTHHDPTLREIFRNKDFRIGLSHAINREEIIEVAYQGQGEPFQAAPRPESEFYDETFAKQYTEFDPDLAEEYLDRVLADRDSDGFRLRPDGERLRIAVEFALGIWPAYPDVLDLIKQNWEQVGVDLIVKGQDRSLYEVRTGEAQKHDAAVWQGAGGWNDIYLDPYYYLPTTVGANTWAYQWLQWYLSDGNGGEEPPPGPKRQIELFKQLQAAADLEGRATLMQQILNIAREEFYVLGINLQPEEYATVANRVGNVPDSMPNSWVYPTPGPTNPEQYFLAQ